MSRFERALSAGRDASIRATRTAVSRRAIPAWVSGGAIVVALVTIKAIGGFNPAELRPSQLAAGDEQRTPLYAVSVLEVQLTDEIEEQFVTADEGQTLVLATMRIENLARYPVGLIGSADRATSHLLNAQESLIELEGSDPSSSIQAWYSDGSQGSVMLQPRVPAEVEVVWPVPSDAVSDGSVTFDVYAPEETTGRVILASDNITWERTEIVAQITAEARRG